MAHQMILTERRGKRVALLTMNRPESLNAMHPVMLTEMYEQVREWDKDPSVGAIVVTGAGKGFCAGADVSGWARNTGPGTAERLSRHGLKVDLMPAEYRAVAVDEHALHADLRAAAAAARPPRRSRGWPAGDTALAGRMAAGRVLAHPAKDKQLTDRPGKRVRQWCFCKSSFSLNRKARLPVDFQVIWPFDQRLSVHRELRPPSTHSWFWVAHAAHDKCLNLSVSSANGYYHNTFYP